MAFMRKKGKQFLLFCLSLLLLIALAQASKIYSAENWRTDEGVILVPGIIKLKYLYLKNRGMVFGMFQNQMSFLAALSLPILLWMYMVPHPGTFQIPESSAWR